LHDLSHATVGSNHRTRDVIVNVPSLNLGEDNEEDFWKNVYYPQLLKDDSDVVASFFGGQDYLISV